MLLDPTPLTTDWLDTTFEVIDEEHGRTWLLCQSLLDSGDPQREVPPLSVRVRLLEFDGRSWLWESADNESGDWDWCDGVGGVVRTRRDCFDLIRLYDGQLPESVRAMAAPPACPLHAAILAPTLGRLLATMRSTGFSSVSLTANDLAAFLDGDVVRRLAASPN